MLRAAQADIPAFIEEVEREIALETKTTEQEMVPVKSGELRRSVDAFERRGGTSLALLPAAKVCHTPSMWPGIQGNTSYGPRTRKPSIGWMAETICSPSR